jgi:hypothetical protein
MRNSLCLFVLVCLVGCAGLVPPVQAQLVGGASVWLRWTAPADRRDLADSTRYSVSVYLVRFDTLLITSATWPAARAVPGAPVPSAPGARDSVLVAGLAFGRTYYFALKSADANGNFSALSNVPSKLVLDVLTPAAVLDLEVR